VSAAILLASFGVAVALVIVTGTPAGAGPRAMSGPPETEQEQGRLTMRESLDTVHAYALNIVDCVRSAFRELERPNQAVLAAVGFALLVLGLFLVRLAGALACSALGAALVFAGLTALLILKGSDPIALMERQGRFYGLVLLGMTAFGTLEQLVLCPSPKRRRQAGAGKSGPRQEESEHHWRTH
jgi:hypothetical protein